MPKVRAAKQFRTDGKTPESRKLKKEAAASLAAQKTASAAVRAFSVKLQEYRQAGDKNGTLDIHQALKKLKRKDPVLFKSYQSAIKTLGGN